MSNPQFTSLAKSAVFTISAHALNFTDNVNIEDGENGDAVNGVTDNAQTVNGMFVDAIKGDIVITCTDLNLSTDANAYTGATGSLVVAYQRRAQGKGLVSGQTLSVTYANAQIRAIKRVAGVTGQSSLQFIFGAYDPAGAAVLTKAVA